MFGDNLRVLRLEKGLTQHELAKALNVANGTIAMWETNKRSPDFEMANKLCNYFNVDLDFMFGRTDTRKTVHNNEDEITEIKILNRAAKRMSLEQRKKLLDMAKMMFEEKFDD
jgi:transcriptional regulator with XRE-family HTH domain